MKIGKWKMMGFVFLGIIMIAGAAIGFEYNQLQPTNHFKNIPVVSTGKKGVTGQPKQQSTGKAPAFNLLIMGSDERPGETIGHSDT